MALKRIRLELARNEDFPDGSPTHGYEVTLPLTDDGRLDADEFETDAQLCTFLRFQPDETDRRGQIVLNEPGQWAFSYELGDLDDERVFKLDSRTFRPDEFLTITHVDGREHVYRIVSVEDLRFPQAD